MRLAGQGRDELDDPDRAGAGWDRWAYGRKSLSGAQLSRQRPLGAVVPEEHVVLSGRRPRLERLDLLRR
jgi:hypothetical protein